MTEFSKDERFLDAYTHGRDMYATMGTGVYNNDYWDNMEHYEDGTPNVEGKKRRKKMKTLLLGMMYGMGPNLLAAKMDVDRDEADKIINDFYTGFPQVQNWMRESEQFAKEHGYVEDFWGRRRRLPDIQLPPIEVKYSKYNSDKIFNPILGCNGKFINSDAPELKNYLERAKACKYKKELDQLKAEAEEKGIYIKDNSGFIATAERQCVNARIQGGAATMTKKAMVAIANDKEMQELGFKLLIAVHDELIGECPEVNKDAVAERLSYLMKTAVPELSVPFKCDAEIEDHWYANEYSNMISKEYKDLLKDNDPDKAFKTLCYNHIEQPEDYLRGIVNG